MNAAVRAATLADALALVHHATGIRVEQAAINTALGYPLAEADDGEHRGILLALRAVAAAAHTATPHTRLERHP